MPLLLSGEKFHDDLYKHGCLAVFAPLEGGSETRLLRRMRAKGFKTFITSATVSYTHLRAHETS